MLGRECERDSHLKAQFYQQAKDTTDYIYTHLYVYLVRAAR